MANGTSSMRESVCASKVLPVPVGPISKCSTCSVRYRRLLVQENPLVVVVHRHREFLFRAVLPDDVAIQELLISGGRGSRFVGAAACSRFSSSRIVWQTPTHSLQMYARG